MTAALWSSTTTKIYNIILLLTVLQCHERLVLRQYYYPCVFCVTFNSIIIGHFFSIQFCIFYYVLLVFYLYINH